MASITEICFYPLGTHITQLETQLNNERIEMHYWLNRLEAEERELAKEKGNQADLEAVKAKLSQTDLTASQYELLSNLLDESLSGIQFTSERLEKSILFIKTEYERRQATVTRLQQRLDTAQKERITLTLGDVKQSLSNFSAINPRDIKIGEGRTDRSSPYLTWVFSGIKMRPLRNDYSYINSGQIPAIRLPDCKVTVYFDSGNVYIKPKRGQRQCLPVVVGGEQRVHPHILEGDEPCLGDFGGNVMEAVKSADVVALVSILQLFLEQADPEDGAGRYWVRYIDPDLSPNQFYPVHEEGIFTDERGKLKVVYERHYRVDTDGNVSIENKIVSEEVLDPTPCLFAQDTQRELAKAIYEVSEHEAAA